MIVMAEKSKTAEKTTAGKDRERGAKERPAATKVAAAKEKVAGRIKKVLGAGREVKAEAPVKEEITKEKISYAQQKLKAATEEPWTVLRWPKLTEKALASVESENILVFVVRSGASKPQIKKAMEAAFNVKVATVNTLITTSGEKKAFVKLRPEYSALDIATKLGMI